MTFSELKTGASVYVFDRQAVELSVCKVGRVSPKGGGDCPKIDIELGGVLYTIKPDNSVCYTRALTISPNRDKIIEEAEAKKAEALERLRADREELMKIRRFLSVL